jgi:hypothetical protein
LFHCSWAPPFAASVLLFPDRVNCKMGIMTTAPI